MHFLLKRGLRFADGDLHKLLMQDSIKKWYAQRGVEPPNLRIRSLTLIQLSYGRTQYLLTHHGEGGIRTPVHVLRTYNGLAIRHLWPLGHSRLIVILLND